MSTTDYRYGSKPKSKNVDWEKLRKYIPEPMRDKDGNVIPWDDSPATQNFLVTSALNAIQREKEQKQYEKQHAEELKRMKEREEKERERRKLQQEYNSKYPERQLEMLLFEPWKYPRYEYKEHISTRMYAALVGIPPKIHQQEGIGIKVISIEAALSLLREEFNAGKTIRLDEQTHNRLVDIAKPGETAIELINRLLDEIDKEKSVAEKS